MAHTEGESDDIFRLALYLLTSARGCLDEPKIYGVVRLLEVLVRLIDLQKTTKQLEPDSFLESMKPRIDRLKILIMENPKEVQERLDETIREFTAELEKRTL